MKVFNEHIPLALFFSAKFYSKWKDQYEKDEIRQFSLIGLWKACQAFNDKEETWTSFVHACINNEIRGDFYGRRKTKKAEFNDTCLSINETYEDDKENKYEPIYEEDFSDALYCEDVDKLLNKIHFSDRERQILIEYYYKNQSTREIAKKLKTSHQYIGQILLRIKHKVYQQRHKLVY